MRCKSWAAPAVFLIAGAMLAGCTGIPSTSSPQIVANRVGGATQGGELSTAPPVDACARCIVADYLGALATHDPHHTAARSYLTTAARTQWSDKVVTIVDSTTVSNLTDGVVSVTGRQLGTLGSTGAYTPSLAGDGTGGTAVTFSFGMKQVNGQWRIDTLQNGVILSSASFQQFYAQQELYFFDLSGQHLVPDPRFTEIVDPALLATWFIGGLITGPSPGLQNALTTEFGQADPARVTVTIGSPSTVELPGAGQLDGPTRSLLAAQVSVTLAQDPAVSELSIVDAGRAVTIPQTGSTRFSASDFQAAVTPANPAPALFYIRGGGVVGADGRPLPGALGNGAYGLSSAAVASSGSPDLRVAGVAGSGSSEHLLIGTEQTGLRSTTARGRLSRPAWVPERDEVWVGDDATVLRCGLDGRPSAVPLSFTGSAPTGAITALRFSPEGSRVAMVITASDGSGAQVWVGAVVRNQTLVRVDSLQPVTPIGVAIRDVAWNDPLKLFVIGRAVGNGQTNIYEVQVDGSLWTPRNVANLPQDPDTITVAENQDAWVSAGQTVWVQRAGSWTFPGNGPTPGTDPVYLE